MKRLLFVLVLSISILGTTTAASKETKFVFKEASKLNIIGKIHKNTSNPYHRVDTADYKGFTRSENHQLRVPAGMAVLFKTNSTTISVKTKFGWESDHTNHLSTMQLSYRGYDLYIKVDDKWVWAAAGAPKHGKGNDNIVLITNMDSTEKECMLYLPIYSELYSVKIGVEKGSTLESLESPFRHRIGIYGSSFTQGISTSRAGMSYPMQLMRMTGLQFLSLGCAGNCKMQPYFAEVLCDADVDALVFDTFSNPGADVVEERLFSFIEEIQEAHPDIPLIFQQTIYRERRNFNKREDNVQRGRQKTAERLMNEACSKYKNVYFITPDASDSFHETSVDGVHPGDYGYMLWARSIEKPLLEILAKYGIQ